MPTELERWTVIEPSREFAFIALAAEGEGERMVGVSRSPSMLTLPAAGISPSSLLTPGRAGGSARPTAPLIAQADERGVALLSSVTSAENRSMLSLALSLGFAARREFGDSTFIRIERRLRH